MPEQSKDALERAESNWFQKAHAENLRCQICSTVIPYGEQDIYFERGLCSYCAHLDDDD